MNKNDLITPDLQKALRRLRLSPILEILPERLVLARQNKLTHQDFLLQILTDEIERRTQSAVKERVKKGKLNTQMRLENWNQTANVTFDQQLWSELCSLRFIESHYHVLLLGPVGVGKTFLANTLGNIACRRGYSSLLLRGEKLSKQLKAARLDDTYDREMRHIIGVDLLIIDDFGLDKMDIIESRDFYDIIVDRHQRNSMIVTSNREPKEWLALMADPIRAQSVLDRLQNNAYELVVEGESYRKCQKPKLKIQPNE